MEADWGGVLEHRTRHSDGMYLVLGGCMPMSKIKLDWNKFQDLRF